MAILSYVVIIFDGSLEELNASNGKKRDRRSQTCNSKLRKQSKHKTSRLRKLYRTMTYFICEADHVFQNWNQIEILEVSQWNTTAKLTWYSLRIRTKRNISFSQIKTISVGAENKLKEWPISRSEFSNINYFCALLTKGRNYYEFHYEDTLFTSKQTSAASGRDSFCCI